MMMKRIEGDEGHCRCLLRHVARRLLDRKNQICVASIFVLRPWPAAHHFLQMTCGASYVTGFQDLGKLLPGSTPTCPL